MDVRDPGSRSAVDQGVTIAVGPRSISAVRVLILAMFADTLGSGLVVPFELLFGTELAGLTLVETGIALSIGTGLGIAAGPIAGALVDRVGPFRVVIGANAMAILGCLALIVAHGFVAFVVATFILAAAARAFWAAYAPLTAAVVDATDLETWFGRFRAVRYAGIAMGASVASFALLAGRDTGLRLVLLVDAVSYIVAIGLYVTAARVQRHRPVERLTVTRDKPPVADAPGGYRIALGDRANVITATLNVLSTLIVTMPFLALPIFALDQMGMPVWVPGAVVALGTMAVAIPTFFAGRLGRGRPRLVLLAVAAGLWSVGNMLMVGVATVPAMATQILLLAAITLGLGEALYAPTADALPLALAPAGLAGRYSAIHQLAWGISGTLAPVLTAWLLVVGNQAVWLVLTMTAAILVIAYLSLERRYGERAGVSGVTIGGADRAVIPT